MSGSSLSYQQEVVDALGPHVPLIRQGAEAAGHVWPRALLPVEPPGDDWLPRPAGGAQCASRRGAGPGSDATPCLGISDSDPRRHRTVRPERGAGAPLQHHGDRAAAEPKDGQPTWRGRRSSAPRSRVAWPECRPGRGAIPVGHARLPSRSGVPTSRPHAAGVPM